MLPLRIYMRRKHLGTFLRFPGRPKIRFIYEATSSLLSLVSLGSLVDKAIHCRSPVVHREILPQASPRIPGKVPNVFKRSSLYRAYTGVAGMFFDIFVVRVVIECGLVSFSAKGPELAGC